jgi:excisionase family DNA binding protein
MSPRNKELEKDRLGRKASAKPRRPELGTGPIKQPEPAKATRKSGGGSELKTRQELAQALGYSVRTVDRLTKAKVIGHIRTGRLVRYRLESVLSALHRNCEIKEVGAV